MSQLRLQLRRILPKLSVEANKLRETEARSRWMKLKQITESSKSLAKACAFYGWSEDAYSKWGHRLRKRPEVKSLLTRSRKPYRSPNKTSGKKEKKIGQLRRFDPSLGPERIADDLQRHFKMKVAPSTVYAVLKRLGLITKELARRLTKKHLKRYRRPFPGYLQMDFKYVPYKINGQQFYQLSCVDHHSSWRLIRIYEEKSVYFVLQFLKLLKEECPFPIEEIQTDNDTAFTDKFWSGVGVTGTHLMDEWCAKNQIRHKLIPVGEKELNGKVENTHKQDDREFFAKEAFGNLKKLQAASQLYNLGWNELRRTKALGFKTPMEVIELAYVRAVVFTQRHLIEQGHVNYRIDELGNLYMPVNEQKPRKKIRTRKPTYVEKYLKYLEWEDSKKKLPALITYPMMSQNFSVLFHSS